MIGAATATTRADFFAALFPDLDSGLIELRALPSKARGFFTPDDSEGMERFITTNGSQNLYLGIASRRKPGDGSLANCGALYAIFAEADFKVIPESEARAKLERFPLKPSIVIASGGGLHVYWLLWEPLDLQMEATRARSLLRRLALALGGDLNSAEAARILRIPGTTNFKYEPPRHVLIEVFNPDLRYNPSDLDDLLPEEPEATNGNGQEQRTDWLTLLQGVPRGGRYGVATRIAGHFLGIGRPVAEVETLILGYLSQCNPPGDAEEREKARRMVRDFAAQDAAKAEADRQASTTPEPSWPTLAPEALQGLAGEVVEAIDPHTEADKVAVLAHFLVAVGNLIGAGPHARVQHDRHPARLNVVLVGNTSSGRKGTAWSTPRRLLAQVDEVWARSRIKSGLSSGEGLIYHVRDAREEMQPIRERGRVVDYQKVIVDVGEADKRLLVIEPELATLLKRMAGEANTLSSVIREAWDSGNLSTLTKNSPMRATGAHVSIVAHVTRDELRRYLTETECANGFANRFLWLVVKKSKDLPDGEAVPESRLTPLEKKLGECIAFAQRVGEIRRDLEARELWHAVYPSLSAEKPGMLGAILSRAEAQVLRLSVLYALLDCSDVIRAEHLKAAVALWDYAKASVRYIFREATGDTVADRILSTLRSQGPISETDIYSTLFHRNVKASRIHQALDMLERVKLASSFIVEETGGRKKTMWEATH